MRFFWNVTGDLLALCGLVVAFVDYWRDSKAHRAILMAPVTVSEPSVRITIRVPTPTVMGDPTSTTTELVGLVADNGAEIRRVEQTIRDRIHGSEQRLSNAIGERLDHLDAFVEAHGPRLWPLLLAAVGLICSAVADFI